MYYVKLSQGLQLRKVSYCQLQLIADVVDGGYLFLTLNIRHLQLGTQSTVSSVTPGMTRGATTPGTGHTPRR